MNDRASSVRAPGTPPDTALDTRKGRAARARPFPLRPAGDIEPLIEASEAFPALERAVARARREVFLSFRVFDPTTALRDADLRARGLRDWGALIADARARGVDARLLLSDFDPLGATHLHRGTWRAIRDFVAAAARRGAPPQLIAALHEGEMGRLGRYCLAPLIAWQVRNMARGGHRGMRKRDLLREAPGLGRYLKRQGKSLIARRSDKPARIWPATHHQKLAVIDGTIAILGGLDVDERRYDDHGHARGAAQTWHDVSLLCRGAVAADIRVHFIDCWNNEVPRFNARLTAMGAPAPDLPAPARALPAPPRDGGPTVADGQTPHARLARTVSRRSRSFWAFGPKPWITELERAHLDQIAGARALIYIETQFLRSRRIADALAEAGARHRDLHAIVVLPAAPEDVAFGNNTNVDALHGEWLQVRAIETIRAGLGARLAAFCLVRDSPGTDEDAAGERTVLRGRAVIYPHAKVALADWRHAIVSSANLNGRSLRWDTESGIVWHDPQGVARFQERLWRHHLRADYVAADRHDPAAAIARWHDAAARAADIRPDCPLVAPYPLDRARRFARRVRFVPENMV